MDGARLWNAAVAGGIPEAKFAAPCDSVYVCFSKSLGAPVGSALAGDADFIARGRRFRKQFGGGMRQAGLLAAGALYALRHHRDRLAEDHANARALAEGLARIPGIELDPETVTTNIVRFSVPGADAPPLAKRLHARGVALFGNKPDSFRAVTHLMISREDVNAAVKIFQEELAPH
jgi:threonine aldolase